MSRARHIVRNQFYLLTRRCTQRQCLLRPDEITNNAFIYCLAEAAQRHKIDILITTAESNHHHTVCYDRHGHISQFVEHFHKLVARCMNARWGRFENLWATEEPCITRLLDRSSVIAKLTYTAANPVKDFLPRKQLDAEHSCLAHCAGNEQIERASSDGRSRANHKRRSGFSEQTTNAGPVSPSKSQTPVRFLRRRLGGQGV